VTTLEKAIATYGVDMQLTVAVEEFSELIKEICKCKRGNDNLDGITEEMADCYIMLKQLEIIFDIDTGDIRHIINNKIDRLEKRLEKEGENG
jgi:NTP pyrophosphatase (non-canonical NTP hydrolase)